MRKFTSGFLGVFIAALIAVGISHGSVVTENGRTFLVDRTGERMEITQAVSLGFTPENFQFGIGKNTITPLDDSHLTETAGNEPPDMRVLAITGKKDAKAFSVSRLRRHEIANSSLDSQPVAAAY